MTAKPEKDPLARSIVEQVVAELRKQMQEAPVVKPRLLSVEQAAQYLGRTPSAVYNMLSTGKLKRVGLDGRVYFDVQDLDRMIEAAKEG